MGVLLRFATFILESFEQCREFSDFSRQHLDAEFLIAQCAFERLDSAAYVSQLTL